MFKRLIKNLPILGVLCSLIAPINAGQPVNPNIIYKPTIFSKLSAEQIKAKKNSRLYLSQDAARTISSDPLFPYRARPLYSFIGFEHFPTPQLSLGFVAVYTHEKDVYSRNQNNTVSANTVANVSGVLPYISYLIKPQWLITAQAGGYIEEYKGTTISTTGATNRLRNQVFTPHAGGYVTWIGPEATYGVTVRGGAYYTNQRFRRTIDSSGTFSPTRHFEASAVALSSRLKYNPENTFWNAFLHVEAQFRIFAGARPNIWYPDNGRQNLLYQVGPGAHFKLNETWEVRLLALHTVGFGYAKEERIGIRLRAAI
jgi:hypothetical protein